MFSSFISYLMEEYDKKNYILRQKAGVLFSICLLAFFMPFLYMLLDAILSQSMPLSVKIILLFLSFIIIFVIVILKKGYFTFASHFLVFFIQSAIWMIMFIGTEEPPLNRLDTFIFIIALFSMSAFAVTRYKSTIFIYYLLKCYAFRSI